MPLVKPARPSQMGGISSLPSSRPLTDRADRVEMYSRVALALTRNHAKTLQVLTGESRGDGTSKRALRDLQKHLIAAQVEEKMTHTGLVALEVSPRRKGENIVDDAGVKELGATGLNNFKRRHAPQLSELLGVPLWKWSSKDISLVRLWVVYRLTREYGIIDPKMATPSQVNAEIITIMTQLRVLPLLLTEGDILQNEQDRNTLKNAPEPVRIRWSKSRSSSWWRRVIWMVGSFWKQRK